MQIRGFLAPSLFLIWATSLHLAFAQQPLAPSHSDFEKCISGYLEEGMIGGLDFMPFALPPHGEERFIGAIAETPKGTYFATGDFDWTGHDRLLSEIKRRGGGNAKLIWAGEIRVENRSDSPAFGRITAINETSGEFMKRTTEAERVGLTSSALDLLKKAFPQIVDPNARAIAFDRSAEHLDPDLNRVKGDIRHDFGNSMAAFNGGLEFYLHDRSEIYPFEDMQDAWDRVSRASAYLEKKGYLSLSPDERSLVRQVNQAHSWRDLSRLGDETLLRIRQFLDRVDKVRIHYNLRYQEPLFVHRIPAASQPGN